MSPEFDFVDPKISDLFARLKQDRKFGKQLTKTKEGFDFELLKGKKWEVPVVHSDGIYSVSFQLTSDGKTLTCGDVKLTVKSKDLPKASR